MKRVSNFDPGKEAIQTLGKIVTYAVIINLFFFLLEIFTAFYSNIPGHMHPFKYLFFGTEGHGKLVPWMWTAFILSIMAIALLINPNMRKRENILMVSAVLVFISTWIDKGMGLVIGGFIPNPFEEIIEYSPTVPEVLITLGVWATGLLIITVLYKIAVSIKEKTV